MRGRLGAAIVMMTGMLVITGCGSATSSGSQGTGTSTPTAHTSAPTTGAGRSMGDRSSDRTFHGTVTGHGLTCVAFTTDDGHHYALTGDAVPAKVRKIAHSGFRAGSGAPQRATLTVVGHVDEHAMSTCGGYTVLVAGKVTVESVGQATVPGT